MTKDDRREKELELELLRRKQDAKSFRDKRNDPERAAGLAKKMATDAGEGLVDAAIVAPQGAAAGWADEIVGLVSPEAGETYNKAVEASRERSPVFSMLGEGAGAAARDMALGPVNKILTPALQTGRIPRSMAEGGLIAWGEAEDDTPTLTKGVHTAGGAVLSGGTRWAGRKLKGLFGDPDAQLARGLGATTRDFQFAGRPNDIKKIAPALEKKGILDPRPRDLDLNTMTWKPVPGKVAGRKAVPQMAAERAQAANEKITAEVNSLLSTVDSKHILNELIPFLDPRNSKAVKSSAVPQDVEAHWNKVRQSLAHHFSEPGDGDRVPRMLSLVEINDVKHALQAHAVDVYNSSDHNVRSVSKAFAEAASALEDFIHKKSGRLGPRIRELNDLGHDLHVFRDVLKQGLAKADSSAGNGTLPGVNFARGMLGMETASPAPEDLLNRSSVGRKAGELLGPVRPYAEDFISQLPTRELSRAVNDGSESMSLPRAINGGIDVMKGQYPADRKPQSVVEQIVRKPLPRNTQEIVANREFILAKVSQQAPQYFDAVRDVIDLEPEKLPELMPVLTLAMPHLFKHDKFNRWDGKITDPHLKDMARKEIMDDDNISNTEKALIMNRLNKTGEY